MQKVKDLNTLTIYSFSVSICLCLFSTNSRSNDCATALNAVPLNFLGQGHILSSDTPGMLLTVSVKLQNSHHAASSVCVCFITSTDS